MTQSEFRYRLFAGTPTLHRYALIPNGFRGCLGRRMALVRPDPKKAHPRFLHYYFLTPSWRAIVEANIISGATVDRIPLTRFPDFEVQLPSLGVQQRIASILSAYDDLIENNRRRIELLEQSARLLYKEWFVNMRFPGHEHVRIEDGVPDGWERQPLAELCESIDYGYTASATLDEVGPKFLRITDIVPDIIDWSTVPYCLIEEDRLAKFRLVEGDIVIARTGATVGYAKRLHRRFPEAVFASYLVRLRLKPTIDNLMVGTFVESDQYKSYVKSNVGGAAQPNANARVLSAVRILVPSPNIQRLFHEYVEPIKDLCEICQMQNQQLTKARDLLLPRLMNGEIAV
ncbi:MAG: restriction endonuclease subunit S [Dehalococcoidia bacterium]|nr:restriction endonuclease subunit S [Dehalococcoidia bacterium]